MHPALVEIFNIVAEITVAEMREATDEMDDTNKEEKCDTNTPCGQKTHRE